MLSTDSSWNRKGGFFFRCNGTTLVYYYAYAFIAHYTRMSRMSGSKGGEGEAVTGSETGSAEWWSARVLYSAGGVIMLIHTLGAMLLEHLRCSAAPCGAVLSCRRQVCMPV